MPLTRVILARGKSPAHRAAILDGLYAAMRESFTVPENDFFMVVEEVEPENFRYSRDYLAIARSDDFIIVQLTVSNTRSVSQKKALYKAIVDRLGANPGLRPEDVMINLVETLPANWSFGNGVAHYVKDDEPA